MYIHETEFFFFFEKKSRVGDVLLLLSHSEVDIGIRLSPSLPQFPCTRSRVRHSRVSCIMEGDLCCYYPT